MKAVCALVVAVTIVALVVVIGTATPRKDRRVRRRARVILRALRRGSFEDWMDKHL
jgi:hypothetical protein